MKYLLALTMLLVATPVLAESDNGYIGPYVSDVGVSDNTYTPSVQEYDDYNERNAASSIQPAYEQTKYETPKYETPAEQFISDFGDCRTCR